MQLWKGARPGDADTLAEQSERPVLIALRFITDTILHVSPVGASVDDIASVAHLDAYCPPRSPVWPLLSGTIGNKIGCGKFDWIYETNVPVDVRMYQTFPSVEL